MSPWCDCGLFGQLKFPPSTQYFCPNCYSRKFEKRILNNIPRYIRGHSISVALSGGKDSTTMLHILHKYKRKLRITKLIAIILEEETPEIQQPRKRVINQLKSSYSTVSFIQKSYSELFDYSLPSLIHQSDKQGLRYTPCTICGVLRRHGIMRLALDNKADYIALGNTLEDEAETILLNILRGNPWKIYRDKIKYTSADGKSLPLRIKPLSKVSENTISKYSKINHLQFLNVRCIFAERSFRSEITSFLSIIGEKDPRILYNIISSIKNETKRKAQVELVHRCSLCSSYSPEIKCSACRIIQKIMT
ncbi:MAG: ATP-binding protein [Promethearchaeota archaeon]